METNANLVDEAGLTGQCGSEQTLRTVRLPDGCTLRLGRLPPNVVIRGEQLSHLWDLHPVEFARIARGGGVQLPRWQQAYLRDYPFSGQVSIAAPLPEILEPLLVWVKEVIDQRLNAVLVNWYDNRLGHYIGPHHDDTHQMVSDSPIITVSFGVPRVFRLRQSRRTDYQDITTPTGSVIVLPWETNKAYTHEVTKTRVPGRRISVTFRCFK